jgi:hypothetical protein
MMRYANTILMLVLLSSFCNHTSDAQLPNPLDALKNLGGQSTGGTTNASGSEITRGLKEALRIGTENAVASTGRPNGFLANPLIKIGMPKQFQTVEKGLRLAGFGDHVDGFVTSMNRAAEQATPQAKSIFVDAITSMTIDDAKNLLNGGETAATDFFKAKTSNKLYQAFRPVVDNSMNQVGTVQRYNALLGQAKGLPFVKTQSLDVGDYVTNKSLDGLFLMVAQEEKKIRTNPAARVTDLLKNVFGK